MGRKRTQRVYTRLTLEDLRELERIRDEYGFASTYQILQSLLRLFLAWKGTRKEDREVTVPVEVSEMFSELETFAPSETARRATTGRRR